MARFEFRLPDIGEGISEAEVVAWHVKVGDTVEEDQQIADMMTDKATVEMESPVSGTVLELAGEVGDQVSIGSTLIVIETEGDIEVDEVKAEPADEARRDEVEGQYEAENPGVEEEVVGAPQPPTGVTAQAGGQSPERSAHDTGPTREDDEVHDKPALASPAVRARARDLGIDLADVKTDGDRVRHADLDAYLRYSAQQGYHAPHASRARADETVKVIGMRRRIAENMAASKRAI